MPRILVAIRTSCIIIGSIRYQEETAKIQKIVNEHGYAISVTGDKARVDMLPIDQSEYDYKAVLDMITALAQEFEVVII